MQISPADLAHPEADQAKIRSEVETLLLRLSQDLYEMEICAGEVVPGMEGLVPNYLSVSLLIILFLCGALTKTDGR